jgi:signal transduction histidine kinase
METDRLADSTGALADERLIAFARVLLSVTSLVAIYIDPIAPARFTATIYGLLLTYVVLSVVIAIALTTALRLPRWAAGVIHVVDLTWFGALTSLTGATSSPLTPFVIYVLVAAAYRWGFAGTVTTTAVACAILSAQAIWQAASTGLDPSLRLELNRFIVRTSYTANAGVLLAGLAAYQKQLQLESATVSRLLSRLGSETGIHAALEMATRDLLQTFRARGIIVAVREAETGRSFVWVLSSADQHGLRRLRLNARAAERYLFDGPPSFTLRQGRKGASFVRALNATGGTTSRAGKFEGPPVPFKYATAATISSYEQWFARVFLLDPPRRHRGVRGIRLLQRVAISVTPALQSIYLIRRLRSRAEAAERARIARDLHDTSIQSLIGVEMELLALSRQVGESTLRTLIGDIHSRLRAEIRALRRFVTPPNRSTADAAVTQRLTETLAQFQLETGIRTRFMSVGAVAVPPHFGRELLLIIRAGLSNVKRHSTATRVDVALERDGEGWLLVMEDDGRSTDDQMPHEQSAADTPWSIRERVNAMGGQLLVQQRRGLGVRLEVRLPPLVIPA